MTCRGKTEHDNGCGSGGDWDNDKGGCMLPSYVTCRGKIEHDDRMVASASIVAIMVAVTTMMAWPHFSYFPFSNQLL